MTFPVDSLGPWPGSFGVENFAGEIASANYPSLRLFTTPYQRSGEPMADISRETPWTTCTQDHVRNFSALSYFFGRKIHTAHQVPIGLVVSGLSSEALRVGKGWVST